MSGGVMFFEVMGQDRAKLQGFFGELFGWKFSPVPGMDYALVQSSDGTDMRGGVGAGFGGTAGWSTFYVKVPSVREAVERAVRLGGRVLMPEVTLDDGMRVAVIADPEGHAVGLSSPPA